MIRISANILRQIKRKKLENVKYENGEIVWTYREEIPEYVIDIIRTERYIKNDNRRVLSIYVYSDTDDFIHNQTILRLQKKIEDYFQSINLNTEIRNLNNMYLTICVNCPAESSLNRLVSKFNNQSFRPIEAYRFLNSLINIINI